MRLIRQLTFRERAILYLTILCAGVYVLVNFVVMPAVGEINTLNQEIAKKSTLLSKYSRLARKAPAITALYEELKKDLEASVNLQEETNAFLKEIESMANSSGLIVQGIKPLTPGKEKAYTKVYLEVNTSGDMKSVLGFICTLENASLLVVIPSVKISPQRDDPDVLKLLLKVYKIIF